MKDVGKDAVALLRLKYKTHFNSGTREYGYVNRDMLCIGNDLYMFVLSLDKENCVCMNEEGNFVILPIEDLHPYIEGMSHGFCGGYLYDVQNKERYYISSYHRDYKGMVHLSFNNSSKSVNELTDPQRYLIGRDGHFFQLNIIHSVNLDESHKSEGNCE